MTNTANVKAKTPKKRRAASLDRRKARAGWVFVLPFVIGFIVIYLPIIFDSIRLSFFELKEELFPKSLSALKTIMKRSS